jgi:hypothetical protein
LHSGNGGLNQYFVGTGLKITKNLSAGINMTILSGQINRINELIFTDYNIYNNNSTEGIRMNGINFDYGLQYSGKIGKDYFFNAGASVTVGKSYKTTYNHLVYRYTAYDTRDTISSVADSASKSHIPATYRFGISFGKVNKFTAGFDYTQTAWSKAIIPGANGTLADSKTYRFGLEYTPDLYSNYSYLKRIEYRIGAHMGNSYLILSNTQVKEYGASVGVGLPLRRYSKANIYLDYTRRSGDQSMQLENYYSIGISLNFYDWWFLKKKYD